MAAGKIGQRAHPIVPVATPQIDLATSDDDAAEILTAYVDPHGQRRYLNEPIN